MFSKYLRPRIQKYIIGTGLTLIVWALLLVNLTTMPPLWWDEGWTLTVARNWVERGHYGMYLLGAPAPSGLNAAFPVTAMVALSFRLFGIGIWQGRLVNVFFALGALALLYRLSWKLFNRSVALVTIIAAVFMVYFLPLNMLFVARQVLAEPAMLFWLLAGYVTFLEMLAGRRWLILFSILFWGIALITKAQPLPFFMLSLGIPTLLLALSRCWRYALFVGSTMSGALLFWQMWGPFEAFILAGQTMPRVSVTGLYQVTAFVPVLANRLASLNIALSFGFPLIVGLVFAFFRWVRPDFKAMCSCPLSIVRLSLFVFVSSWFLWYVLLSVGWGRYFFPAVFLGSPFWADFLNFVAFSSNQSHFLRLNKRNKTVRLGLVLLCVAFLVLATFWVIFFVLFPTADNSSVVLVDFLNYHTEAEAIIETYDSELFFLLERPYHFPPDQVHVELNRGLFLGEAVAIAYDPLIADPDYLVVGQFSRMWGLYEEVLETEAFDLMRYFGPYALYQRNRR